jgi:hypothetical protein
MVKVSELTGPALDWAVAKCEGKNGILHDDGITRCIVIAAASGVYKGTYKPSTDWEQGGPIIEREKLCVGHKHQCDPEYCEVNDPVTNCWARTTSGGYLSYGPTPLIAAMRCYCASKLGGDIEIPEELK